LLPSFLSVSTFCGAKVSGRGNSTIFMLLGD